jgi:HEAT repeat protein
MEDGNVLSDLLKALASPDYIERAKAARVLVNLKAAAAQALPNLLALRDDPSWMVRVQVPRATVHLGASPEQAVPILRELLKDGDEVVRGYAAWALEKFGGDAPPT